jgi:hypothetical protein
VHTINSAIPKPIVSEDKPFGSFSHQGYNGETWVGEAWAKYRSLSPAPTDGWKQPHDDSYYKNAVKEMQSRAPKAKPAATDAAGNE